MRESIKRLLIPDRVGVGLAGFVSIGVAVGMLMANNQLAKAGLVGMSEAAEVLAVRGFLFLFGGVLMIAVAIFDAKVTQLMEVPD